MTYIAKTHSKHFEATHGFQIQDPQSLSRWTQDWKPAFCSQLETLAVDFVPATKTVWAHVRSEPGCAHISHGLIRDMLLVQAGLRQAHADVSIGNEDSVRYFVSASRLPGVFNLGGDLNLFAASIRNRDRATLNAYAHACIDVVYGNSVAFDLPIITMALIQGDALGGGFEWALSFDVIVAERSAKIGLPEILFNLFPGMGAYSFLSRRVGAMQAEKMIMSGRVFKADELHAMGVVDVLAEDGEGELAATDYIAANARKHNAHQGIYKVRRRINQITERELRDVVDVWIDTALGLSEQDLNKMERLAAAQDRRLRSASVRCGAATG